MAQGNLGSVSWRCLVCPWKAGELPGCHQWDFYSEHVPPKKCIMAILVLLGLDKFWSICILVAWSKLESLWVGAGMMDLKLKLVEFLMDDLHFSLPLVIEHSYRRPISRCVTGFTLEKMLNFQRRMMTTWIKHGLFIPWLNSRSYTHVDCWQRPLV